MKRYKDDEIKAKMAEFFKDKEKYPGAYGLCDFEIIVEKNEPGLVEIKFEKMYEAPPFSVELLKFVSDYFGTDIIDRDDFAEGGCESCDYGSSYGFTLVIKAKK